jgi:hypothetical protein
MTFRKYKEIQVLAHSIYVDGGSEGGVPLHHWLKAEKMVDERFEATVKLVEELCGSRSAI